MNVLMVGVDKKSVGGMLTVINNYINDDVFRKKTNLKYIATVSRHGIIMKILKFIFVLPVIIITILFKKIDIVHAHMAERGSVYREGFVIKIAKILKRKTIIHIHAAEIEKWYMSKNNKQKKKIKKIFLNADRLLILGNNWKPFFVNLIGFENENKIIVVYNAVNIYKKNNYNINAKEILFFGMLIKRKGIEDLLDAFTRAIPYIPQDIVLTLYGDDAEKNINGLISKYNKNNRIVFKGWLNKQDKSDVFSNTMCHILPSYNEGLPMSILETMAYGIPNISTLVAAIPEAIIQNKSGFLICPGDIDKLKEYIINICNDEQLRMKFSNNSYMYCNQNFSLEKHFKKLLLLYDDLMTIK